MRLSKSELITAQKVDKPYRDLLKDENIITKFANAYPDISTEIKHMDPILMTCKSNYHLWWQVSNYVEECEIASKDGVEALNKFMENYECLA